MTARTNKSKTSAKHISCECKCKFDGRKCNLIQKRNNDKCWCECKKQYMCNRLYLEFFYVIKTNCKYLANVIDD